MAVVFRPDSGRAWIVLLASFVISFLTLGNILTLGVLFERIKTEFGAPHIATSAINLVFALNVAFTFLPGTLAAVVTAAIGYRWTMFLGAVLACFGFGLASAATQLWHLYLSLGVLVGVGFGHLYTPSVGILTIFFDKYRHFAATISSTGVSAGIMAYAFLHNYFSRTFTWSTAMMIEAIICGQLLVCACLMFNPHTSTVDGRRRKGELVAGDELVDSDHRRRQQVSTNSNKRTGNGAENVKLLLSDRLGDRPPRDLNELASVERYVDDNTGDIDVALGLSAGERRTAAPAATVGIPSVDVAAGQIVTTRHRYLDQFHVEMFSRPKFYFLLIEAPAIIGVDIFLVTTPAYLAESHGWTTTSAAFVLTVHGAASLVFRVLINVINAFPKYGDKIPIPLQISAGIMCTIAASLAYMLVPSEMRAPGSMFLRDAEYASDPRTVSSQNFTAVDITTTPKSSWEDVRRRSEEAELSNSIVDAGVLPHDDNTAAFFGAESNLVFFLVFAAVDSMGEALFISYQPSLLMNIMGTHRLTAAFGYLNFVRGLATLALYPVAGMVGDIFGSLRYAYAISFVCCALSLVSLLIVVVLHGRDVQSNNNSRAKKNADN